MFVLGAGVSVPFGFPTGKSLLRILTGDPVSPRTSEEKELQLSHERLVQLLEKGFGQGCMRSLIKDLKSSMPPSIDTWLDYRPSHKIMAKRAIAAVIYEYENRCIDHAHVSDNWFEWIFSRMLRNAPTLDLFLANKITFITFNYDRLLEWKLTQAIRGVFGEKDRDRIQEAAKSILDRIIHVHGSLRYSQNSTLEGSFGLVGFSGFKRMHSKNPDNQIEDYISDAAEGIRIIGEKGSNDAEINRAIDTLTHATKVVFLGFSYDERNLQVLGTKNWAKTKPSITYNGRTHRPVMGSAFGMRQAQRDAASSEFDDNENRILLGNSDLTCVPFCDEHVFLI